MKSVSTGHLLKTSTGHLRLWAPGGGGGPGGGPWPPSPGDPNDGQPDTITVNWNGNIAYDVFNDYYTGNPVSGVTSTITQVLMNRDALDDYSGEAFDLAGPLVYGTDFRAKLWTAGGVWQFELLAIMTMEGTFIPGFRFPIIAEQTVASGTGPADNIDPRGSVFTIATTNINTTFNAGGANDGDPLTATVPLSDFVFS